MGMEQKRLILFEKFNSPEEAEAIVRENIIDVIKLIKKSGINDEQDIQKIILHILTKAIKKYDGRVALGKYLNGVIWKNKSYLWYDMTRELYKNTRFKHWVHNNKAKNFYLPDLSLDTLDLFQSLTYGMNEKESAIIHMKYFENFSTKEIASICEVSVDYVLSVIAKFINTKKDEILWNLR
jgi:DNA-directed RNA polymerase specialized sigma24 family protein